MQVNELKKEKLTREYEVKVPAKTIEKKMDEQLQSISARVKIPGFRPGHIPTKILKQRYGKSVMGEVIEKTVNSTSNDVLKQKGDRPALQPKIEITSFDEGKDLEYKMSYEVLPEIPAVAFEKLNIEQLTYDIPEQEVTESIQRLAERNQTFKALDASAKAKLGHAVKIDFAGYLSGEAFEGGTAKGFQLELGSGQFIPGFEEQLVGVKAGDDVVVKVTFPATYHKADLAGQPTEFKVQVHEVMEKAEAEINDDFAKSFGMDSLEKLRVALEGQLRNDYDQVARTKMKKQLFDQLDQQVKFEAPQGMVDLEFNNIWERLQEAKKQGQDDSLDKPEAELRAEYTAIAERRVRLGLVLAEIGRTNNLKATQDELSRAVMDHARMFPGQEKQVFEFYRQNPGQLEELRGPILEEKAVDFIIEKVTPKQKKVTIEELLKDDEEDAPAKKASAKKKTA
jgi:trigger factor